MTEHNDIGLLFDRFAALKTGGKMTQPQLTVGLSGRISVIFRPDTEEEGREIIRAVEAAPELLEALKVLHAAIFDGGDFTPDSPVGKAQAAIAKAEA